MRKILFLIIVVFLNNCAGYEPILYGKNINFYINRISNLSEDKVSDKIIKKLSPYRIKGENSIKIDLDINSKINDKITSKDSKGDALTFEKNIQVIISSTKGDKTNEFRYNESFSFNNQSNKFELNQYKKNIEEILINKIFEQLIIDLRQI